MDMIYFRMLLFRERKTVEEIINILKISRSTYYRKVRKQGFTQAEINTIRAVLNMNVYDVLKVFYNDMYKEYHPEEVQKEVQKTNLFL